MTITVSPRRIVGGLFLACALVLVLAAGWASAAPQRPLDDDQAYRASCGHLGTACAEQAPKRAKPRRAASARKQAHHGARQHQRRR